jgi:hypothetical protein
MKRAFFSALFLGLLGAIAAVPASADLLVYNSGPGNFGTSALGAGAWTISEYNSVDYTVSNWFTLPGNSTISGATFGVWLTTGDSLSSVDWAFDDTTVYGNDQGSGTAGTTGTPVGTPSGGFSYYTESFSLPDLSLPAGTYYFTLSNALASNGDAAYWDENDGSSIGYAAGFGSIGAYDCKNSYGCGLSGGETFTLEGTTTITPEPSSFLLLGSGLAGLAGLLKRKIRA